MNCHAIKDRTAPLVLTMILTLSAAAAQAQNGMLEIRGVLTSPACPLSVQTVEQLRQQSHITGQTCGLTSGAGNPMSQMQIAHIGEETMSTMSGSNVSKRMVTLTYR